MPGNSFHEKRKPFYLHPESLIVRFPTQKHMNCSHAEWFSDEGIPFLHTIRGYYMSDYIMIYTNDFETPDINIKVTSYLFEYFPNIKWIGCGCNKGEIGKLWSPKIKITLDGRD